MKMKFKDFLDIGNDLIIFTKSYIKYLKNIDEILELKEISDEKFNQILELFKVEFKFDVNDDFEFDINSEKEIHSEEQLFINKLIIDSFYGNYELFQKFNINMNDKSFQYKFTRPIFLKDNNETAKKIEYSRLEKQINNNEIPSNIKNLIIKKSVKNNDEKLFNIIKTHIKNKEIIDELIDFILVHGKKLKNESIRKNIMDILFKYPDLNKVLKDNKYNKYQEQNLKDFFNMDVFELEVPLYNLSFENAKITILSIKDNVEKLNKEDHINKIKIKESVAIFLDSSFYEKGKISGIEKLKFIIDNNLFDISTMKSLDFLKDIYKDKNKLIKILNKNQYEDFLNLYWQENKTNILNSYSTDKDKLNFVKNYPEKLSKDELLNIINGINFMNKTSLLEIENLEIIIKMENNDIYFNSINEYKSKDMIKLLEQYKQKKKHLNNNIDEESLEQTNLMNLIVEKYPELINDKKIFLEFIRDIKEDGALCNLLNKFFQLNNTQPKKEVLEHLKIFEQFVLNKEKILTWVIDNNLLGDLFNLPNEKIDVFKDDTIVKYIPLLKEYGISIDQIVLKLNKHYLRREDINEFIIINYELKEDTKKDLLEKIIHTEYEKLALKMIEKNIKPSSEELNFNLIYSKDSVVYKLFEKSLLKDKLENNLIQNKKMKMKKI